MTVTAPFQNEHLSKKACNQSLHYKPQPNKRGRQNSGIVSFQIPLSFLEVSLPYDHPAMIFSSTYKPSEVSLWKPCNPILGEMTQAWCVRTLSSSLRSAASPLSFFLYVSSTELILWKYILLLLLLLLLLILNPCTRFLHYPWPVGSLACTQLSGGLWQQDLLTTIYCVRKRSSPDVQHPAYMKLRQFCEH